MLFDEKNVECQKNGGRLFEGNSQERQIAGCQTNCHRGRLSQENSQHTGILSQENNQQMQIV